MKQIKHSQIKKAERLEIAILLEKKYSLTDIAKALKRSKGTIFDEIKRNSVNGIYDPKKAQQKAYFRRKYSKYQGMKIVSDLILRDYVETKIKQDWSPEQIAGRLKNIERSIKYASRGAIYKFVGSVYGRQLEKYLRYNGQTRKPKRYSKVSQLENRSFIEKRPQITNKRQRFGDWEGDFLESGGQDKTSLIVLRERKGRYSLLEKIPNKSPVLVNQKVREMTVALKEIKSLTLDNDIAFRKHERLSKILGIPLYFCHPYHSWEKGGVENENKLIRQYFTKDCRLGRYSERTVRKVQEKLNNRPRKCLGYKTPLEIMLESKQFKTLNDFANMNKQKTPLPGVRIEG